MPRPVHNDASDEKPPADMSDPRHASNGDARITTFPSNRANTNPLLSAASEKQEAVL
jgi:hypothetical protein